MLLNKLVVNLVHGYPQQPVLQLHIYNRTSVRGRGYHFDSLLPIPGREAESKKKRSRTVAATNATKIEAESIPTGSQLNDLQREPQRNGGTPEKPSCNNEAAEQQADQRAETVFAKVSNFQGGAEDAESSTTDVPMRLDRKEAQRILVACLLSKAGSWETVTELLQQSWVSEWDGWQELQQNMTEEMSVRTATYLYDLAMQHRRVASTSSPSSSSTFGSKPSSLRACILCKRGAPDYAPHGLQDTYSAECSTCKRRNCNQCGSWEGAKFFCKWCFDEGITPSVEAMQTWKAVQQTCKSMRHRAETADWTDILSLVLLQAATPAEICRSSVSFDPKEVVVAICLSHFQDFSIVEDLLAQQWVKTWAGWDEIADDASDAALEALAVRFMRLAMEHAPSSESAEKMEKCCNLLSSPVERYLLSLRNTSPK